MEPAIHARGANSFQPHSGIQQTAGQGATVGQVCHERVYPFNHGELERIGRFPDCRYVAFGLYPVAVFAPREERIETRRAGLGHRPRSDSANIAAGYDGSEVSGSRNAVHLHQVPGCEPAGGLARVQQEDSARFVLDESGPRHLVVGHHGPELHRQRAPRFLCRQGVNLGDAGENTVGGRHIGARGQRPFQHGGAGARPHRERGDLRVIGFREQEFLQGQAQFAGGIAEPLLPAGALGDDASAQPDPCAGKRAGDLHRLRRRKHRQRANRRWRRGLHRELCVRAEQQQVFAPVTARCGAGHAPRADFGAHQVRRR